MTAGPIARLTGIIGLLGLAPIAAALAVGVRSLPEAAVAAAIWLAALLVVSWGVRVVLETLVLRAERVARAQQAAEQPTPDAASNGSARSAGAAAGATTQASAPSAGAGRTARGANGQRQGDRAATHAEQAPAETSSERSQGRSRRSKRRKGRGQDDDDGQAEAEQVTDRQPSKAVSNRS